MPKENDSEPLYPELPVPDVGKDDSKKRKSPNAAPEGSKPFTTQPIKKDAKGDKAKFSKQAKVESEEEEEAKEEPEPEPPTTREPYDAENADEDEEIPLRDYTPDEKKKEVLRIFSWPDWAYYEILEVEEDATEAHIKKAYHKKSKLTHTDRNDDVQAKEVFQRVHNAYESLSDKDKRKEYNLERKVLKKRGLLVQKEFDESFERRAYEEDSDDEPEDDDKPMSKEKRAIIDEMGPFVKKILNSCDKDAIAKLVELNQKMIDQNKSEGIFATNHCLPLEYFNKTGKERKRLMKTIQKPPQSDEDIKGIEEAENQLNVLHVELEKRMEDLELPKDWTFELPPERRAAPRKDNGKGQANRQASSGAKDAAREGEAPNAKGNGGASSSNRKRGMAKQQGFAPSAGGSGAKSQEPDPMDVDDKWQPGETTQGEKILAYRPKRGWAQEKGTGRMVETETVNDFVIERKGEPNPIEIVTAARVGLRAVNAYLALPEEQKNCITNIDREYDRTDGPYILDIKGFARKFSETASGNLPWGVALIDYDGEDRIVNRSALRKALPSLADDMINDFLVRAGEEPEEPKYVRLRMRLENTRNQLRLEETLAKLRLETGQKIPRRAAQGILHDYDDSDHGSDSDLFVSDRRRRSNRRDESHQLTGRQTERPRVRIRDSGIELNNRRRAEEGRGDRRGRDDPGNHDVVTHEELQSMMNQMMQQITAQFMQMRLPAVPDH